MPPASVGDRFYYEIARSKIENGNSAARDRSVPFVTVNGRSTSNLFLFSGAALGVGEMDCNGVTLLQRLNSGRGKMQLEISFCSLQRQHAGRVIDHGDSTGHRVLSMHAARSRGYRCYHDLHQQNNCNQRCGVLDGCAVSARLRHLKASSRIDIIHIVSLPNAGYARKLHSH